jgi:phosphatidylglycerophosphate synthase
MKLSFVARRHITRVRYIIPSAVSVFRVGLTALIIIGVTLDPSLNWTAAVLGVPIAFLLDAVDGILARRLKSQTVLGSFVDIAADRLVEFAFVLHFVLIGLVPLWFVGLFYCRILITDSCRMLAFGMDRVTASGIELPRGLRFFVLSKASRSGYAGVKALLFSLLLLNSHAGGNNLSTLEVSVMLLVLAFSLLRAAPILITYLPQAPDLVGPKLRTYTHPEVRDLAPRSTKIFSCLQLAGDFCLTAILLAIAVR